MSMLNKKYMRMCNPLEQEFVCAVCDRLVHQIDLTIIVCFVDEVVFRIYQDQHLHEDFSAV